jgi:hypothetical protein
MGVDLSTNINELPDTRLIKDDNIRFALAGLAAGIFLFLLFRMVEGVM